MPRHLILTALLVIAVAAPALSAVPTASPSPGVTKDTEIPIAGGQMTVDEFTAIVAGAIELAVGHLPGYHVTLKSLSPGEMPKYAQSWYYEGTTIAADGTKTIAVDVNRALPGNDGNEGTLRAMMLGLCDAGFGSVNMKALYDKANAADVALGPTAANPFLNRFAFGDRLGNVFDIVTAK